jgi:hypothetical protein
MYKKMLYYIIPGTTSEEIDNKLINDLNVKEGNERINYILKNFTLDS